VSDFGVYLEGTPNGPPGRPGRGRRSQAVASEAAEARYGEDIHHTIKHHRSLCSSKFDDTKLFFLDFFFFYTVN